MRSSDGDADGGGGLEQTLPSQSSRQQRNQDVP
jgi:hypothetical protein